MSLKSRWSVVRVSSYGYAARFEEHGLQMQIGAENGEQNLCVQVHGRSR
jgi:hypothetical protein